MTRLPVVLALVDTGLSAGEAAHVVHTAAATLDSTTETITLAAARILESDADLFADLAHERRAAAQAMRALPMDTYQREAA